MSKEFDKTNTFTLSRNKDKSEDNPDRNEKWPDYKGRININGEDHWLSAWLKTNGETGEKFFSGKIGEKVKPKKAEQKAIQTAGGDMNDDIPFAQFEKGTVA